MPSTLSTIKIMGQDKPTVYLQVHNTLEVKDIKLLKIALQSNKYGMIRNLNIAVRKIWVYGSCRYGSIKPMFLNTTFLPKAWQSRG